MTKKKVTIIIAVIAISLTAGLVSAGNSVKKEDVKPAEEKSAITSAVVEDKGKINEKKELKTKDEEKTEKPVIIEETQIKEKNTPKQKGKAVKKVSSKVSSGSAVKPETSKKKTETEKKTNSPVIEKEKPKRDVTPTVRPSHPESGTRYTGKVYPGNKDKDGFQLKWVVDVAAYDYEKIIYEERYETRVYDDELYFVGTDENHYFDGAYVGTGVHSHPCVAVIYDTREECSRHYEGCESWVTEEEYTRLVPTEYWDKCSKKRENLSYGGWMGPVDIEVGREIIHCEEEGHWEYK